MKNKFLLLIFNILIFSSSISQRNELIIFSEDNQAFNVNIDGQRKTSEAASRVNITFYGNTKIRITVHFEDSGIPYLKKSLYTEPGTSGEYTMRIFKKRRKYKMRRYSSKPLKYTPPTISTPNTSPNIAQTGLKVIPEKGKGVTDIDGNVYPSIIVDGQEWMAANLVTTKYANGESIPEAKELELWKQNALKKAGSYCYYENNPTYQNQYGNLYNWYVVNDERNVCPQGWRVPTSLEWEYMIKQFGGKEKAGRVMKTRGNTDWVPPTPAQSNASSNNQSGFSARGSGTRFVSVNFGSLKESAYWWSADKKLNQPENEFDGEYGARHVRVSIYNDNASSSDYWMSAGFSIRCVKDH
jgi:uncharacterized protein (TIGR02145 family)